MTRLLAILGGLLVLLTVAALALHIPGADTVGSDTRKIIFVALLVVGAACYLAAVHVVLRRQRASSAIWIVLVVAVVMRLPPLLAPPFLSSDVYRYVWDGEVQNAGFNPYSYIPADPALAALRDAAIYPDISRADYARTIYPPTAQIVFRAVAAIDPSVLAMKLAMVAFEAVAIGAVLAMLRHAHLPVERVLIYAWNPLAVWAFAGNGHADAIGIGLLALALLARTVRRDTLAGAVLGAASLVKLFPLAVAPAFWRRDATWRMPLACVATIAALYLCYIGAGRHVFGFLTGYLAEEDLTQGSGIWLLAGLSHLVFITPLAAKLYIGAVAIGLLVLAIWIAFRDTPEDIVRICGDVAMLAACVTVAISPHYPWYFAWLALPCCLYPRWSVMWLSVAPVLLYLDPWHERFFWPCLVYLPAGLLATHALWRRGWRPTQIGLTERSA
jgi:alpha-1,6-mannosyltransferase